MNERRIKMSIIVDMLYNATIKVNDDFAVKRILGLAGINRHEDFKSLELQVRDTDIYNKTEVKIQVFDEQGNEVETYDNAEQFSIEYDLIDFIFGVGPECVLGDILKENKTIHDKAKELYNACEVKNETKIETLRKDLGEELIDFDNRDVEPLIVIQFYDFIGEVRGIKLEVKDVQYRPTFP